MYLLWALLQEYNAGQVSPLPDGKQVTRQLTFFTMPPKQIKRDIKLMTEDVYFLHSGWKMLILRRWHLNWYSSDEQINHL